MELVLDLKVVFNLKIIEKSIILQLNENDPNNYLPAICKENTCTGLNPTSGGSL